MSDVTIRQLIGACLVALPFVALFALAWREMGLLVAVGLYAGVAALVGVICAGTYLMTGSLS